MRKYDKESKSEAEESGKETASKPTSTRSKGRRNRQKPKSKGKGEPLSKGTRDNDPNWYFTDSKLAEQVSQLSFQNMVGTGPIGGKFDYATILKFKFNPSIGCTYSWSRATGFGVDMGINAPVNAMAVKIYTLLSSYTGRTSTYAPQDITTMICAQASLLEVVEATRRIFGILQTTNVRSRILPTKLINSMGIQAADLYANIPAYRMRFNSIITRANQIPLLGNITMLQKSRDFYQRIYLDAPSPMAQIFYYVPATAWQLDESSYEEGTICKTVSLPFDSQSPAPMSALLDIMEELLNALLESSTLQIIYSDLINLANKTSMNFFSYDYLTEDYVVLPEYNANALLQMHNLAILKLSGQFNPADELTTLEVNRTTETVKGTKANDIVPNVATNSVIYNPVFTYMSNMENVDSSGFLIDFDVENPSIEDKIEAMRMSFMPSNIPLTRTGSTTVIGSAGSTVTDHYCIGMDIYDSLGNWYYTLANSFSLPGAAKPKAMLTQVDHAPILRDFDNNVLYGELNYWTTVSFEYLERVNQFMLLGLFDWR